MAADAGMNELLDQTLTVWGETMSAQFRDCQTLAGEAAPQLMIHHIAGAPRSSEDGRPYALPAADAILLRDMLNAATARGELPPRPTPGVALDDIAASLIWNLRRLGDEFGPRAVSEAAAKLANGPQRQ